MGLGQTVHELNLGKLDCHPRYATKIRFMFKQMFWVACALLVLLGLPPTGDWADPYSDFWSKAQLSLIYGAATALGTLAYPLRSGMVIVVLSLVAMTVEMLQLLAPWLTADLTDILAAFTGITVTRVLLAVFLRR